MLSSDEFNRLFDDARREWFRLETRDSYAIDAEKPRLDAYLAGQPQNAADAPTDWYNEIRAAVARGVRFRKVTLVHGRPLSAYQRWGFEWSQPGLIEAGQDTRVLDLSEVADAPALPESDWWLFDGEILVAMHYDPDGHYLGAERLDDELLPTYRAHRDAAWNSATPVRDYWAAHPTEHRDHWLATPDA